VTYSDISTSLRQYHSDCHCITLSGEYLLHGYYIIEYYFHRSFYHHHHYYSNYYYNYYSALTVTDAPCSPSSATEAAVRDASMACGGKPWEREKVGGKAPPLESHGADVYEESNTHRERAIRYEYIHV
jgi:hypothetical protein